MSAPRHLPASTVAALVTGWAEAGGPAYRALAERIRLLIADGRVPPGARLPSERELTEALGVSRTTVASAYRELRDRGYLSSRRGSGSVTSLPSGAARGTGGRSTSGMTRTPEFDSAGLLDLTCAASPSAVGIGSAVGAATEDLASHLGTPGYHPQGLPELREEIAAYYEAKGLPTTPDQIVVTAGALAGTALALRSVAEIGDRVLTESPTHPNSMDAIRRGGNRIVAAPMTPHGWDLPLLEATIRQTAPRVAWMVVDFQNPSGRLMPDVERERLALAFARNRTTAIIDETLTDLCLGTAPMPAPFATYNPRGVITVGSLSKSFWGGLRIGWLRVPPALVARVLDARASMDLGAPVLEQLIATRLLAARDEILPERRTGLLLRRDTLMNAVREHLPSWSFEVPGGGLSLWCELPEPVGSSLVGVAERNGVLLMAGSRFSPDGGLERFIRLPYTIEPDALIEAVRRIAAAYAQLATALPRRNAAMIA
ncbi:MocR-like transcription factor YczR [Kribbella deserti]|uniref:PLP-dependent aminotransferase family protein n=1 Tax=Kribbella deserti TaxID=1926257 RepID=A0ABV6QST2_9ACTN